MLQFFGRISLLVAAAVLAVALAAPAQAAEVKTKYFSIDLPADWTQPQPVQEGNGALMALFVSGKDGSAVTIMWWPTACPPRTRPPRPWPI